MGSTSDLPVMEKAAQLLNDDRVGVAEVKIND